MQIVLHTIDLEPITVIELEFEVYSSLVKNGSIKLKVNTTGEEVRVLRKEVSFDNGDIHFIFIADKEEVCLNMLPAWLPGQRSVFNLLMERAKK